MDQNRLALILSAAKFVKDEAAAVEKAAKAKLTEIMDPGDRKVAMNSESLPVGSVSRTVYSTKEQINVVSEPKLIEWLKEHQNGEGVRTVETVEEWKLTDLLIEAQKTGELPDGVEITERTSGGYLQVRQTEGQKESLVADRIGIMTMLDEYKKEIEG